MISGLRSEVHGLEEKFAKLRDGASVGLDLLGLIRRYCRDKYGLRCRKYEALWKLLVEDYRYRALEEAYRKSARCSLG